MLLPAILHRLWDNLTRSSRQVNTRTVRHCPQAQAWHLLECQLGQTFSEDLFWEGKTYLMHFSILLYVAAIPGLAPLTADRHGYEIPVASPQWMRGPLNAQRASYGIHGWRSR